MKIFQTTNMKSFNSPRGKKIFGYAALAALLIFSFFARTPYLIPRGFIYDENLYAWQAQRLGADLSLCLSKEIIEYHPPLFPLLLWIGKSLIYPQGDSIPADFLAYRLTVVVMSLIGVWAIFLLGRRISGIFLGLFSAIALSFDYSYLKYSIFVVNDMPFAVLCIFLLLALAEVSVKGRDKTDFFVGILLAVTISLKYSAMILVPFVAAFYLSLPSGENLPEKFKKCAVPLSIALAVIIFLVVNNVAQTGNLLPASSSALGLPSLVNLSLLLNVYVFMHIPYALLGALIWGCYCLFRQRDHFQIFLFVYIVLGFCSLLSLVSHDLRYGIFILPAVFLITGIGLEQLLKKTLTSEKRLLVGKACILFIFLMVLLMKMPDMDFNIRHQMKVAIDFSEAADWIQKKTTKDTVIISQEMRTIRYLTGINYAEFGGQIKGLPTARKDIKKFLRETNGRVILEVNVSRDKPRSEFHPFRDEKREEDFLEGLGFQLKKVVCDSPVARPSDMTAKPIIKIFERVPVPADGPGR